MNLTMIVEERKESIDQQCELTLRGEGDQRFSATAYLRARVHPDVSELHIGDRLRMTIEKVSVPVSDVERTIEEAERAHPPLSPAMLV